MVIESLVRLTDYEADPSGKFNQTHSHTNPTSWMVTIWQPAVPADIARFARVLPRLSPVSPGACVTVTATLALS